MVGLDGTRVKEEAPGITGFARSAASRCGASALQRQLCFSCSVCWKEELFEVG